MKYALVAAQAGMHAVARLCAALGVSRSGYYEWRRREPSRRALEDERLLGRIREVHHESRENYGALKTWTVLRRAGESCGRHRVARLRRSAGIEARRKRRFRLTVERHVTAPPAPNRLQRCFAAAAPDRVWVGDATFIATRAGWLHLAVLLDLHARRVVGWAMGERPTLALSLDALAMALARRRPAPGLVHHTDRGAIYTAAGYQAQLARHGMIASMSRKGDAWDNAVAESFFSTLKNELVHHRRFRDRDEARAAVFEWIEVFYNRQRIHAALDFVIPSDYEAQYEIRSSTRPEIRG